MIFPFPTRIRIFHAMVFTSLLALVQLLEHTDPRYAALTFCFFMLSVFAFNTAGGLSRASGAYIFFFSVLAVVVGTIYKAIVGQAAETFLQQPLLLMSANCAIMAGMLLAAFLARKIATTRDGMAAVMHVRSINFSESALGCLVLYVLTMAGTLLPGGGGAVLHAVNLVNPFLPLTMILGTIAAVRNSKGARSTSPLTWVVMGYAFGVGVLAFSKQGMFTPIVCWGIGMAWARFRLRFIHFVVLGAFAWSAQALLVPLSNVRDDVVYGSYAERFGIAERYLLHPEALQKRTREWIPPADLDWRMFYYGKPEGIWDRLSMLPNDSVLISFSDQGHYFGYRAIRYYFENWVPHIIDPHKLAGVAVGGNAYSHEMGELAEGDTSTGISFSPTAEAYHIGGWPAVLLAAPPIFLLMFVTVDAVCGDIRRQPWGLPLVLIFAHVAPEGGLGAAISAVWLGNIGTLLAIFCCGYITPVLGMLLSGRKSGTLGVGRAPVPRPLQPRLLQAS